ncbi:unnamed protein product, partial [Amoebophrya sp. A25]
VGGLPLRSLRAREQTDVGVWEETAKVTRTTVPSPHNASSQSRVQSKEATVADQTLKKKKKPEVCLV